MRTAREINATGAAWITELELADLCERVEELETVANGVIWLDNNIHNYGSDEWRGYFKAVLRDARRGLGSGGSSTK